MFDYVIVGTFTSVVLCRCGKIFKVLTGDGYQVFFHYIIFEKWEEILLWWFRNEHLLILMVCCQREIEAKYLFCFVCTFQDGHFFYCSFSLWVNIKKPMLNELRLLLYAAGKYNERNGKLFFLLLKVYVGRLEHV